MLIFYQYTMFKKKSFLSFLLFLVIFLSVRQIFRSNYHSLTYQSEIELVEMRQRMIDYPPRYYRLAHIIEERPESRIFFKLQSKFFNVIDLKSLPFFITPLVILGLFKIIEDKHHAFLAITLLIPIVFSLLFGPENISNNYSLYPFIFLSSIYGLASLIKK